MYTGGTAEGGGEVAPLWFREEEAEREGVPFQNRGDPCADSRTPQTNHRGCALPHGRRIAVKLLLLCNGQGEGEGRCSHHRGGSAGNFVLRIVKQRPTSG